MNVSVYIGRRLSFGGSGAGVPIAVGGIALALVIMMVSIAVVTGFKDEIRLKVQGFNSEITVSPRSRTLAEVTAMRLDTAITYVIAATAPGARVAGVVELPGILKTVDDFQGVVVKAQPEGSDGFAFIARHITSGRMPSDTTASSQPDVCLSATIASKLGLTAGDKVDMHFVADGALRTRRAVVTGIYDTHFGEYDSRFVYIAPAVARGIARIADDEMTSVEINGIPADSIEAVSAELSARLLTLAATRGSITDPLYYAVDNLLHTGQAYFSWLDLLDTNVVVILVLMALVSGFTLISCLFILILERVRTIGILKSLGGSNGQIRGIFIYMAERLVVRGLIIGNAVGIAFLLAQKHWHIVPLDPESYFLNFVPVTIDWLSILLLNIAVVTVSGLILIAPSHMIATLAPSESMRYE